MNKDSVFSVFSAHKKELQERGVKNLAVFGSVIRGESTDQSDVDILVEFNRSIGLFDFVRLKYLLEEWIGCKVDLVTQDALHPALRERILKEAVYGF